ncbi:MAG: FeoB-associated Cys-rich membrane protein [Clostridiales Family XIII bacterium]|jgi:hypothetical protein|nr:FeoB-associated Cys-rich membrane protein [Clostridiales Family XIII bacterium]
MIGFFRENWGTILVGLVVAAVICSIVVKLVRDRAAGKCPGCDCGCSKDGECPKAPRP